MKLEVLKKPDDSLNTASIHKTGKMGFSLGAVKLMNLNENKFIQIAINKEDLKDESLYLIVKDDEDDNSYRVSKAGNYYYINTRALFEDLKYDFINEKYYYRISKVDKQDNVFKLTRRLLPSKRKVKKE